MDHLLECHQFFSVKVVNTTQNLRVSAHNLQAQSRSARFVLPHYVLLAQQSLNGILAV